MENNRNLQVIYTWLCNFADDKAIKEFITQLQDYAYNGSFVDYEITTTDYDDMFIDMIQENCLTSDDIQNLIYELEKAKDLKRRYNNEK